MGDDHLQLPTYTISLIPAARQRMNTFGGRNEGFAERQREVWEPMSASSKLRYSLDAYRERLEDEITIIERMKYEGYFLVVWDFVNTRAKGHTRGPGPGSAAGSLAAIACE